MPFLCKWIACVILFMSSATMQGQLRFVQFIVQDLDSESDCRWIEEIIQLNPGIESVRLESHTDNFLAFIEPGVSYSESDFENWLLGLGYSISCYRSGVLGVDRILRLTPADCVPPQAPIGE